VADHKRIIEKKDAKVIAKGHHLPLHNTKELCGVGAGEKGSHFDR